MKKSVTIRKALPGETPGYYNKTAKFLNKALPKAKTGMQVGNGLQDKLKVIMLDTYSSVRDGADPQEVFRKLLMEYGMPQQMAYQIMQTVMAKLAKDGYADPARLQQQDDTWDDDGAQAKQGQPSEPEQPVAQNQNPGTPDEDEELALSESSEDTGYDGMDHFNNRNVEQEEEQSSFAYGGYFDDGGYQQSVEDNVMDQYSNPGQLSMEQKAPMSIEAMLQSFNLPNNATETPDLNAYLQGIYNYRNVGSDDIPNEMLPTSKHGGAHINLPLARNGRSKKTKERKPEPTPTNTTETETRVEPTVTVVPQESIGAQPSILQGLQNAYFKKNALAPQRGAFGTTAQIVGTGLNYIRPQNWRQGWREGVAPSTTATKTYQDIYNILMDKEYKPETLIPNEDGTFSSGLAFNMGPDLYKMLSKDLLTSHSVQTGLKNNGVVQLEFPTSSVPELNFLSLHNEKSNTKVRLVQGADGALKVELVTDVKTPLKGVDKNTLTIKDEFFFDPNSGSLIDPKTGMPLEQIQKSYFKGNELNWYNQSGTFPFTKKYGKGLDLSQYPTVVSGEPLKQTPPSRWSVFNNLVTKPLFATPYVLPFTYPGFAARSKFYPESNKVTVDYFGRARDLGPQTPGGMTFGDQPFGTQYADYNLQANRNYLTGRNFMIGAGLLGAGLGGGYLYYNRDTKDWDVGSEQQDYVAPTIKNPGFGYSFDLNGFGRKRPAVDYKENNYGLDSMYIQNGDTIHDKGWGVLAPSYKAGGAHKKKFLKRVQEMFEPGGENQDPSLGKGNRMDTLDSEVSKKKNGFIDNLKKQSDKASREELYDLVQKSGDPKLMNIFMGDDQSNQGMQQPMQNRKMAEGGDPCPEGSYWDEYKGECVPRCSK